MDSTGSGSFLRNRRFDSYFNTTYTSNEKQQQPSQKKKITVKQEPSIRPKPEKSNSEYVDDDGWYSVLISCVRIVTCFLTMMVTTFVWSIIMILLLPWPKQRIRQGNVFGHVTGKLLERLNK